MSRVSKQHRRVQVCVMHSLISLVGAALGIVACSNPDEFELESGVPTRVEGCTVYSGSVNSRHISMQISCDAPASAVGDEQWWGAGHEPLGFQLSTGDCVIVGQRYYCVSRLTSSGAEFRATFRVHNGDTRILDRVED